MKMTLRKRKETLRLLIDLKDIGCETYMQYYRACRAGGEIDTGYHYFVSEQGNLETGREPQAIAGWHLPHNETTIAVIVMSPEGVLSDSQRCVLDILKTNIKREYPEIIIVERKE